MRALQPQTDRHVKPLLPHSSAVELPSISSSEEGDKRSDADTRGDWEDKRRQSARARRSPPSCLAASVGNGT